MSTTRVQRTAVANGRVFFQPRLVERQAFLIGDVQQGLDLWFLEHPSHWRGRHAPPTYSDTSRVGHRGRWRCFVSRLKSEHFLPTVIKTSALGSKHWRVGIAFVVDPVVTIRNKKLMDCKDSMLFARLGAQQKSCIRAWMQRNQAKTLRGINILCRCSAHFSAAIILTIFILHGTKKETKKAAQDNDNNQSRRVVGKSLPILY